MSAKEMFEKLGYEDTSKQFQHLIRYVKNDSYNGLKLEKVICIDINRDIEDIEIELVSYYGKCDCGVFRLEVEELQAINKQVEELWGGNNEK